jgi:hypothetical protein
MTNQTGPDPLYNGFEREILTTYLQGCMNNAEEMGVTQNHVLRLFQMYGFPIDLDKARGHLNAFVKRSKPHYGSDGDTRILYRGGF